MIGFVFPIARAVITCVQRRRTKDECVIPCKQGCVPKGGCDPLRNGKISCRNGGSIRLTYRAAPTVEMLKKLLSTDSPYTDIYIDLPGLDEPKLVLTEDLEIAQGKTLSITKGDQQHVLVVPKGITLTNNGTLALLGLKVEGHYEGQPPLYMGQT